MTMPVYVKDEIVDLIVYIYNNFTLDSRNNIKGVIRDLIGKYSEPTKNHRYHAEYISVEAKSMLKNKTKDGKFKNASELNTYIQKNFRHEHMTPKDSIRSVFEYMANNNQPLTILSVTDALNTFSKCAIITLEEDGQLLKLKHPAIVNNEAVDLKNFDIELRYSELHTKTKVKIELVKFVAVSYLI